MEPIATQENLMKPIKDPVKRDETHWKSGKTLLILGKTAWNLVKPSQTQSNPVKPSQTQSNPVKPGYNP